MSEPRAISIQHDADLREVYRAVRAAAAEVGFGSLELTRMLTIASEITRNVLRHAGHGHCILTVSDDPPRHGLCIVVTDEGEGIDDLALAFQDGFSTVGGLGLGLGGARRLASEFELTSTARGGTMVRATLWSRS